MTRSEKMVELISEQMNFATIQVTFPDYLASKIQDIRDQIPEEFIDYNQDKDISPHVTIFYGLGDEDYPLVSERLQGFDPLGYTLKGELGIFEGKDKTYKVFYLPIQSNCFHKLHSFISEITRKEPPTFREYKPHATIAYVKANSPTDFIRIPFQELSDYADNVQFCTTDENIYQISLV